MTARDLDPLSPIVTPNVGWTYILAGQNERAIKELHHVLEIDPKNAMANFYLGNAHAAQGRYNDAIRDFQKALEATGGMPWCAEFVGCMYGLMHEGKRARNVLKSSLAKIKEQRYVPSSAIAMVHLGLGDQEPLYECLARCVEERDALMPWLKYAPGFNQLVRDPRMQDILARIGLQ